MGLRDPLSTSVRRVFANPLLARKLSDPGLRRPAFHLDPRPQLSVPGATSRENPSSKIQRCRGEVAGSTINTLVLDKISREHPASRSGKVHCKQTMDEGREYRIQRTERKQEGVSHMKQSAYQCRTAHHRPFSTYFLLHLLRQTACQAARAVKRPKMRAKRPPTIPECRRRRND